MSNIRVENVNLVELVSQVQREMTKCLDYGKGYEKENVESSTKHMRTVIQNLVSWISKFTDKAKFEDSFS